MSIEQMFSMSDHGSMLESGKTWFKDGDVASFTVGL